MCWMAGHSGVVRCSPPGEEALRVGDSLKPFGVSSESLQGLNSPLWTCHQWEQTSKVVLGGPI